MKINVLGVEFDNLSFEDVERIVDKAVKEDKKVIFCDINTYSLYLYHKKDYYKDFISKCNYVVADGMSIVFSSILFKRPLKERLSGIDVMQRLIKFACNKNYKVYLLGSTKEIVFKTKDVINAGCGKDLVIGYRDGFFEENEFEKVLEDINKLKPNILFIGISSPKRELFINFALDKLQVNFIMGVGGSFEVLAGFKKRAPKWIQKIGFEWLYRLIQDPKGKFLRYLISNSYYLYLNIKYLFKKN
jgi:N-acetylglucosaminyldiphosphoundecaprenol N-acetyl-beta-D-mannosaminyltransferase